MTNKAATFVGKIDLIWYFCDNSVVFQVYVEYCGNVKVVCEYRELSQMYCGNVKVVCAYCGSVVNVYGVLKSCGSVIVVCGNNGSVINVY